MPITPKYKKYWAARGRVRLVRGAFSMILSIPVKGAVNRTPDDSEDPAVFLRGGSHVPYFNISVRFRFPAAGGTRKERKVANDSLSMQVPGKPKPWKPISYIKAGAIQSQ